jgi:hypothetical protein
VIDVGDDREIACQLGGHDKGKNSGGRETKQEFADVTLKIKRKQGDSNASDRSKIIRCAQLTSQQAAKSSDLLIAPPPNSEYL